MEQSTQNKITSGILFGLLGISFSVGFFTLTLFVVLFLAVVGGSEWGLTLAIFVAPIIAIIMGVGSLLSMGIHAILFFKRRRQATFVYLSIWVIGWLISLALLTAPFLYTLIDSSYYWPENSLPFTLPLALFIGLLVGAVGNWLLARSKAE